MSFIRSIDLYACTACADWLLKGDVIPKGVGDVIVDSLKLSDLVFFSAIHCSKCSLRRVYEINGM